MIFVEVRDLSKLDTSSKLTSCTEGPDDDGTKEQNRCPGMGRACMNVGNEYKCTCHYPFETKIVNGTEVCECPKGKVVHGPFTWTGVRSGSNFGPIGSIDLFKRI